MKKHIKAFTAIMLAKLFHIQLRKKKYTGELLV